MKRNRTFSDWVDQSRTKRFVRSGGWRLSLAKLPVIDPAESKYFALRDYGFESPDGNRLALVHSSREVHMGHEVGMLSVFERKVRPKLIFGAERFWVDALHHQDKWLTNDLLIVSIGAADHKRNIGWTTYALIDLKRCVLSVIPVPLTYAYSIRKERNKVIIEHYDDVPWFPTPSLRGMQFKIRNLPTISFEDLNHVHDVAGSLMYFLYLTDLGSHRYKHLE